jgi:hypothetical protein
VVPISLRGELSFTDCEYSKIAQSTNLCSCGKDVQMRNFLQTPIGLNLHPTWFVALSHLFYLPYIERARQGTLGQVAEIYNGTPGLHDDKDVCAKCGVGGKCANCRVRRQSEDGIALGPSRPTGECSLRCLIRTAYHSNLPHKVRGRGSLTHHQSALTLPLPLITLTQLAPRRQSAGNRTTLISGTG